MRATQAVAPFLALLAICAALAFSLGIDRLPPTDRDEARFAQASKQMSQSGDLVDIRFQDGPRHKKPIGIYWAQTLAAHVTGHVGGSEIWVYRLPSVLAGTLAVVALVWAGAALIGWRWALVAGVMMASTLLLQAEARIAKTDAALLACVVLAMGALARVWMQRQVSIWVAALFWTALAVGFLVKGPMVLLPVLGAMLWVSVYDRGLGWMAGLRPLAGLGWFLLLAAPWYILITLRTEGAFLDEALGRDLAAKVQSAQESHGAPPGSYFLTFWLAAWPWTALAPMAWVAAWRLRKRPEMAFLLGWILPIWALLEWVPTKLVHYPLPLYPAVILACVFALREGTGGIARSIGVALWGLGAAVLAGLVVAGPLYYGAGVSWPAVALALLALAVGAWGCMMFYQDQTRRAIAGLAASGAAMCWALFAVAMPAMNVFWISPRLAAQSGCHDGAIYLAGFHEPSAVFLLGTETVLTSQEAARAALQADPTAIAWLPGAESAVMVRGLNYSNGREVALGLYVSPGVPATEPICGGTS